MCPVILAEAAGLSIAAPTAIADDVATVKAVSVGTVARAPTAAIGAVTDRYAFLLSNVPADTEGKEGTAGDLPPDASIS